MEQHRKNLEGRGPCLSKKLKELRRKKDTDLKKAYLNMAPSQTLKWIEQGKDPSETKCRDRGNGNHISLVDILPVVTG